jgi:alpha-tubulin suppressor-like RCC1 family protein
VSPGSASQLAVTTQAAGAKSGAAFTTQPVVEVRDAAGNRVTDNTATVTIAICDAACSGSATRTAGSVDGIVSVTATAGTVSFSNLGLSGLIGTYTLKYSSSGLQQTSQSLLLVGDFSSTIAAGNSHTCGVANSGTYCWGNNQYGQLGNGSQTTFTAPSQVSGSNNFSGVAAGNVRSCGLTASGTSNTYCWGTDGGEQRSVPTAVSSTGTSAGSAGGGTRGGLFCSVDFAGKARCWGESTSGSLGQGTTGVVHRCLGACDVTGGIVFTVIDVGPDHACGLDTEGKAYCWGQNTSGELGTGTIGDIGAPALVSGVQRFVALALGDGFSCGLAQSGQAYCWGLNNGRLGDGTTANRLSPTTVIGGYSFSSIASGNNHVCGLTSSGAAYCWGANESGQLGDGSTTSRTSPVPVTGGLNFVAVTGGGGHTCGLAPSGSLYCWGKNDTGQIGNGSTSNVTSPTAVSGGLVFRNP